MPDPENKEVPSKTDVVETPGNQQQVAPEAAPTANTELDALKDKVANLWLKLQDQNNEKRPLFLGFSPGFGVSLNPLKGSAKKFLLGQQDVTQNTGVEVVDDKKKEFQLAILSKFYDKTALNKMKEVIAQSTTVDQLEALKDQIKGGEDPTKVPQTEQVPQPQEQNQNVAPVVAATGAGIGAGAVIETIDKTKRERVTAAIDGVLEEDSKNPIKYKWGSKDDAKGGLDCSGLVYHTVENAGLKVPAGDSRSFFKQLKTQLVELNEGGKSIKNNLGNIKRGDLIFWNSINPKYKWSAGEIPSLKKDGKSYRIHHIAFIEKINYKDGTIDVVESNGSDGVTKSTIDVQKWLTTTETHQSELYVAPVNYNVFDELPKKQVA